jgi:thioredoxin 1
MTQPEPATGTVTPGTDDTYRQIVLTGTTPVLVAFVNDGNAACQALRPILTDIARDRTGRLRVVTIDVDANPATSHTWGITDVPVMLLLHRGILQRVLLGVRPYARLAKEIDETHLPQPAPSPTTDAPPTRRAPGTPQHQLPELPL